MWSLLNGPHTSLIVKSAWRLLRNKLLVFVIRSDDDVTVIIGVGDGGGAGRARAMNNVLGPSNFFRGRGPKFLTQFYKFGSPSNMCKNLATTDRAIIGWSPMIQKKLKTGKYFLGNYYVKFGHFSGKNHVEFGNFVNCSGKYKKLGYFAIFSGMNRVKFGHFVNFTYIFFRAKMSCPPKVDWAPKPVRVIVL